MVLKGLDTFGRVIAVRDRHRASLFTSDTRFACGSRAACSAPFPASAQRKPREFSKLAMRWSTMYEATVITSRAQRVFGARNGWSRIRSDGPTGLSKTTPLILYCTCVREATSLAVANLLRQQGLKCTVLKGGLRAWRKAGLPVEPVPPDEIVALPSFASSKR